VKWLKNLLTAVLSTALFLGGTEMGFRLFASHRILTYYDEQTERALGTPIPKKESGEYRIFVFGGSSAYGFPVADRYSITAWLRKSFPHLLPHKKIAVVNCGWPGKGSHHVVEGTRTVMKYQPDLFIIYVGHNDFPTTNRLYTDNRLYWLNLRLTFRSSFYRYLQMRLNRIRKWLVYGKSGYPEKHYREEIIAQKVYQKAEVIEEEDRRIFVRYRENIEEVVRLAKAKGVDLVFLSLPSNLKGIPPAQSSHAKNLSSDELAKWDKLFEEGQALENQGRFSEAVKSYRTAAQIDPTHAGLEYRLGITAEKAGDYETAKQAYILARDCDRLPTRGKSEMNKILREVTEREGILFVDIASTFDRLSPHGIISPELIYDDVHPSIKGQQIIVDEILHALHERGKVAPSGEWQWAALEAARENPATNQEWQVDGSLNAYRYILRGLHLWGQGDYSDCIPDLEKGIELMPGFTEAYAFLGDAYFHLSQSSKAAKAFQTLTEKDMALADLLMKKYPELSQSYHQTVKGISG